MTYSAIVLPDSERDKLLSYLGDRIPEGWEIIAHHCTINMGPLPEALRDNVGLPVQIQVIGFYINDKVCASQVVVPAELQPFMKNKYPHITLGVNRAKGGKPVMSNDLIEAGVKDDLESEEIGTNTFTPLRLTGVIMEVTK